MKKHFLIATIMVPFMIFVGYALTDWYLNRNQEKSTLLPLTLDTPGCTLQSGCQLHAKDFVITILAEGNRLIIKGNQRIKDAMLEVVDVLPPSKGTQTDVDGYVWQWTLPRPLPEKATLHFVIAGHWQNYLGELTAAP